ncbi:Hsp70 family protein [Glycomyces xiaoerkulensis]|uniref:Hsp70 family protein n=1 Tax=Glycomyces xiaoerkulensis TaxID=2038139 RepID=UPI000C25FFAF|nr:Hsp70 family protein [Glycomyces xiaoerkulensis]
MQSVSPSPGAGIDPEAAAARFAEVGGRPLDPGAALVVYRLGEGWCEVAVVREAGDRHLVAAGRSAPIGGRDFDELLLAYLSGRHHDASPRFWDRLGGPSGAADDDLRAMLLGEIRRARERLSEAEEAIVSVPRVDLELGLGRVELETRLRDLVGQTVDLVEAVLGDTGLAASELSGLLLAGGAARTPLVRAELHRRLDLEPVFTAGTVGAVGETASPSAEPDGSEGGVPDGPPRRRTPLRVGVFASVLLMLLVAGAAFGTKLGDHPPPGAADVSDGAPEGRDPSGTPSASPGAGEAGQGGEESESPGSGAGEPADPPASPDADAGEEPTTEAATAAPVPDVVGGSAGQARDDLDEAGFTEVEFEGRWSSIFDFSRADCEVIEQDPAAGAEHGFSDRVTVTFAYHGSDSSDCFD